MVISKIMSIRQIQEEDYDKIAELYKEFFPTQDILHSSMKKLHKNFLK
jgi:L-amino acid N-acyltransferase YncA